MQMELILLKTVKNLGKIGETARVAMGYGRYLLRQKSALRATPENIESFQVERAQWEALNAKHKEEAQTLAALLEGKSFLVIRQAGETGHLYGSVSNKDVADLLSAEGFHVERSMVHLVHPIKTIDTHVISLELHSDVKATIYIIVAKTEEEGLAQKNALERTLAKSEPMELGNA